jgi:hypothetical protein
MKATRVFQLTALALVLVAAVQVGWWLFDQRNNAMDKVRDERTLYARQVVAAQAMLDAGVYGRSCLALTSTAHRPPCRQRSIRCC